MPRDIPVGNGDLLVNFDELYRARDLYYPMVGRHNHTGGHVQRFGVWADDAFAWVDDPSWTRVLRYLPGTLVTEVRLHNQQLGLEIVCNDSVDFHEPVLLRRVAVRDLLGTKRDVRIFFHFDLSINESPVGDTANYDPGTGGIVMYKEDSYFLVNGSNHAKCGVDQWSIGTKRVGGAEGTWRDAEDGKLGRNNISQGSVDATIGFDVLLAPKSEQVIFTWLACGRSFDSVKQLDRAVWNKGPEKMVTRTQAYWSLWASKEPIDLSPLPETVRELYTTSQLILRTQVDNRGAILAATDSDVAHYAGDHYAYCWPRDGALVAHALVLAGQSELSRNFFRYAARVIHKNGYFLHKYTPAGNLASSWHPWTLQGKPVLPIQQDETALVLWALREHFEAFRDVEFIKPLYNSLVIQPATWMLEHRDHHGLPRMSWDLWEERRGIHTFTVAATIGALVAAGKFARDFGDIDKAATFEEGAERMKEALLAHLWNPAVSRFARMATPLETPSASVGTIPIIDNVQAYTLDMTRDSANFALFAFGAFRAGNPMVMSEMKSLRERLWVQTAIGGCARYEKDYFHQVERLRTDEVAGNPWVICTLWHAQHAIAKAKSLDELQEAIPLLEWTASRARPSGVLAEQFHPYSGDPISVSPLTWSHATVVTTVVQYIRRRDQMLLEHSQTDVAGI
ncbi:MAG: glycoside hydrolase family 15 protein [Pyrinomonadaceae bacterium]|nr:glycoside hydrolase family 15 protein [Phycisphaerales bacterium]